MIGVTALLCMPVLACREDRSSGLAASHGVDAAVHRPPPKAVVKGSQQPKCRVDSDCPSRHACACVDIQCTFLPVSDVDPNEPNAGFCIPLPTLWGGELPPGVSER